VVLRVVSQTGSINIIWKLVRNANYLAPPRPTESEALGVRAQEPQALLGVKCMLTFERRSGCRLWKNY